MSDVKNNSSKKERDESEAPLDEELQDDEADLWKSCRVGEEEGTVMAPGAKLASPFVEQPVKARSNGLESYNSNSRKTVQSSSAFQPPGGSIGSRLQDVSF